MHENWRITHLSDQKKNRAFESCRSTVPIRPRGDLESEPVASSCLVSDAVWMHENWRITHWSDQKLELLKVTGPLFAVDLEKTWSESLQHRAVLSRTHFGCIRIGELLTTRTRKYRCKDEDQQPTPHLVLSALHHRYSRETTLLSVCRYWRVISQKYHRQISPCNTHLCHSEKL